MLRISMRRRAANVADDPNLDPVVRKFLIPFKGSKSVLGIAATQAAGNFDCAPETDAGRYGRDNLGRITDR
jgi:hypothetical protein